MRTSAWLAWMAVGFVAWAACDKKPETGSTTSAVSPSASASASGAPSASATASPSASASGAAHPGACKQLLSEKATRCDAMAKGDPTIESACKEAIDRMSGAGDDGKCWNAMNPPEAGPPQDDVPE